MNNNEILNNFNQFDKKNDDFLQDWQNFCQAIDDENLTKLSNFGNLQQYVNGKNLACPMPLLKLKMALKTTDDGQSVYVTATDPNSEHDIKSFCQHAKHDVLLVKSLSDMLIFHIIVKK